MMNNQKLLVGLISLVLILLVLLGVVVTASEIQTVQLELEEINAINVNGTPQLTIGGATAGEVPEMVTDSATDLRYTSTVSEGNSRAITAQITLIGGDDPSTSNMLILGLNVEIEVVSLSGSGDYGNPVAGKQELSDWDGHGSYEPKEIITGIGNGVVGENQATVEYSLSIFDMALVEAGAQEIVITYTLTDES